MFLIVTFTFSTSPKFKTAALSELFIVRFSRVPEEVLEEVKLVGGGVAVSLFETSAILYLFAIVDEGVEKSCALTAVSSVWFLYIPFTEYMIGLVEVGLILNDQRSNEVNAGDEEVI